MEPERIDPNTVLAKLDGGYFLEYARFTGAMREYEAASLEEQFKREPNDLHRRMFLLAVYREQYSAYEDLGAFLNAFLTWASHRRLCHLPI